MVSNPFRTRGGSQSVPQEGLTHLNGLEVGVKGGDAK